MKRYDLIVVGAGPAGLSAAIEGAKNGLSVVVFDENAKPGGQLFKQIHKFFGSKEHHAKIRGYNIGEALLESARAFGVEVILKAVVIGIYPFKEVMVAFEDAVVRYKSDAIIVATGASENMVDFKGWTLPGVIGAGAAQTMMNLHGIKPGKKVLMLGSGNVGLVVSYQLLQAGCEVVAVVDAASKVGGYGVHAAKLTRTGIPFYRSHTIIEVKGETHVTGVTIGEVNDHWQIIEGTQKEFEVDTVCLAVGLSPMSQLLKMAGCKMKEQGGTVPTCNSYGETSVPGIYVAGDVSGIEEASSAMIEGRICGIEAAYNLGYMSFKARESAIQEQENSLKNLRQGMFGPEGKEATLNKTDEGYEISSSLLEKGYLADDEVTRYPGVKNIKGIHPVIECTQNIPCNPCQEACPKGCIKIGDAMTSLPGLNETLTCTGCGLCVAACSGQAIFLMEEKEEEGMTWVTMPYEFSPLPKVGERGKALNRSGTVLCEAEVVAVKSNKVFDHTHLLTIKIPIEHGMSSRFYKRAEEVL